ncbi:MAG: hypothetical protein H6838_09155 [Planctomycetes bacterium]|nr:hypothetical protein [Planctomycetota bacterium]
MIVRCLLVLLTPAVAAAQIVYYPRIEITEVLIDPVGVNAGRQVVEFEVGNAPVDTTSFVFVVGSSAVPFPSLVLPAGQRLRAHLGASGVSSVADLYFPTCPTLAAADSIAIYDQNALQVPAALVDFVAWGSSSAPLSNIAVLAGRWPSTLVFAVPPTVEGATLANRRDARIAWIGPDAWYRDTTPTLGLPNDPGMTWNLAQGCTSPMYPPAITTNDVLDSGPWVGQTHTLVFGNLPLPSGLLFLAFGVNSPGPVDLVTFGMPGCYLHVAPDTILVVGHALGFGQFTYQIPGGQQLVGFQYHVQALVPDPAAANPAHALMSNALIMRIGSR